MVIRKCYRVCSANSEHRTKIFQQKMSFGNATVNWLFEKRGNFFLLLIQRVFDTDIDTDGTNEAVKVICKTYVSDKIWYCILSNIII